jgi:hypothetical protein
VVVAAYSQISDVCAMGRGGQFLTALDARPRGANQRLAIASNSDSVKDPVFEGRENDATVSIDTVCGAPTAGEFGGAADGLVLPGTAVVAHACDVGVVEVADEPIGRLAAGLPAHVTLG